MVKYTKNGKSMEINREQFAALIRRIQHDNKAKAAARADIKEEMQTSKK